DLEKVFNSTLEMDDLVPVIAGKFRELLETQAVNLWLVEDEGVRLMAQAGDDPTVDVDRVENKGGGIAGDLSDSGESVLITDPSDPRLAQRNAGAGKGRIFSLMAAPILSDEFLVGVVEVVNSLDGTPFDEDSLFLLQSICETAAGALHNASLLLAERKVEVLEALVKVSQEITSTLDLERVLDSIVNGPSAVIPYERAAIALEQRGKLQLRAMTGAPQVVSEDPNVRRLQELLEWASLSPEPILVTQHDEEIDAPREEAKAKFARYFAESGMRAFHALPLVDDDGRVGILSFESSDPDFLTTAHLEMIKILAAQATVALRNASLYREVPFINVLEPVLQRKRKFMAMEKQRRNLTVVAVVAAAIFLAVFPLPLRVDGDAQVGPARAAHLQPEVEGVVKQVYVREGDPVRKGTVLASLEDWEYRAALAAAEAKHQTAVALMDKALAGNDGTEAGIQRLQADYWAAEVARARERLERTNLRSPIDGVVATAHVEDQVGRRLKFGDNFADVVNTAQADVDVGVDERDVSLVREGQSAAVKLDGYPTRTFHGQVSVVSPRAELQGDQRVFMVRVAVPNPGGVIRTGMQGRSKVSTGWRPAGVVLFRHSAMWVWSKVWEWLGW
ncbi:MAG TPA: efflux RND transporter periplasmic adaptor subunit, partial [Terriglobales bacterium]|nr:efflux RND transporter periplasmic adaptor subunit [Terriglobales bacterium]